MNRVSGTPRYTILVTVVEGRYFLKDPDCNLIVQCQFNDALFIENAETNSHAYPEILSTDPTEQTPYPIWDTELAWDLDAEVLDILRVERASLKITCFAVNQKTNQEHSLGHIILDLAKAFESESAEEHWVALQGADASAAGFRGLAPELKIAFTIDQETAETAPTIDTLLTSIESVTASTPTTDEHVEAMARDIEEEDLELTPKIKNPVLQDMFPQNQRDQDIESHLSLDDDASIHHDSDAVVPDHYFEHHRHSSLDSRVPSVQSRIQSMSIDIPVAVGEALIPPEVVEQGFLQLGLGRDYFLFTITLQSVRDLDEIVNRYAALNGKDPAVISQQLYLYYTFLGNHIATQYLTDVHGHNHSSPIEETSLRLKSSMESMYQHFREDEQLVIHLCHKTSLLGTVTIPMAVILLHGTANLFHASPQFYPFDPADGLFSQESVPTEDSLIQVAMHITRDLNTLSVPSTPAVRRSSQGASPSGARRIPPPRPSAIEVNSARKIASSASSRSPKRHDYKFSIELQSFKSNIRHLNNVSLRYNYRPFGPKSTQPPINVKRGVEVPLPDASRTFQLCQTPEALANQLQTPLVVEVWVEHPDTGDSVFYASGQIPLSDILKEPSTPSPEGGLVQVMESRFRVYSKGESVPTGEIQSMCSLEDQGEYVDSQQSDVFSTTPVHSMELEAKGFEQRYHQHRRDLSQDQLLEDQLRSPRAITQFAEGYSDRDREMSQSGYNHQHSSSRHTSGTPRITSTGAQRPPSVRLSQVRHLSTAHQSSHSHSHHPYGKAASPSNKQHHHHHQQSSNASTPQVDYHQALKQQLAKQIELNKQIELDLLRRSPISNLPHSLHQTLQHTAPTNAAATGQSSASRSILDSMRSSSDEMMMSESGVEEDQQQPRAIQKMKELKGLDYQVQKQLVALEFRERKLKRAEEALARQQAHFQKLLERHNVSTDSNGGLFQHPNQKLSSLDAAGHPHPLGTGPSSSLPNANDYFLLQDRFRSLQRQNQLLEAEFAQYRQEHPAHINMTTINNLMATIQELEGANAKLQNDVMFAKNYKEHYKALWTHSLQEIAAIRQDLQMGMEIKMMQASNEVDQMRVLSSLGMHASHHSQPHAREEKIGGGRMRPYPGGDEATLLRGVKTELEMLQQKQKHHQQQYQDEEEEDADMSWEQDRRHHHPHQHRKDDDDSVVPSGGRGGHHGNGSSKTGGNAPSRQGSGHSEHDHYRQSSKRSGGQPYNHHQLQYSSDDMSSVHHHYGSSAGSMKGYGGMQSLHGMDPEVLMEMMMASNNSAKPSTRSMMSAASSLASSKLRPRLHHQRSGHSFLEDDDDDDFDGRLEDEEEDDEVGARGSGNDESMVPGRGGSRPFGSGHLASRSHLQRYLAAQRPGGRRGVGRSEDEAGDLDEDEQDDTLVDLGLLRHSVPMTTSS